MSSKDKTSTGKRKLASSQSSANDIEDLADWTDTTFANFRSSLLSWYDNNHRVLPWRRNPHSKLSADALQGAASMDVPQQQFIYWVWVCEVMSQQTQIERVREYWTKWTAKWPTVADLAEASEEEVNQMWAGLGYYRRARYLLEGAKAVRDKFEGVFPTNTAQLQQIPGVGAYTGNAIASIACGEPVAVMDANVIRVVSRLFCVDGDPSQKEVLGKLNALAGKLLDPERPGDFNQAMMEMGAVVCLGNGGEPKCDECPLNSHCGALKELRSYQETGGHKDDAAAPAVTRYPSKAAKKEKREEHVAVCVLEVRPASQTPAAQQSTAAENRQMLLVKRPDGGLLAGLWEFPSIPIPTECKAGERRKLMDEYLCSKLQLPLGGLLQQNGASGSSSAGTSAGEYVRVVTRENKGEPLVHVFSHIRMTLHVEHLVVEGQVPEGAAAATPGAVGGSQQAVGSLQGQVDTSQAAGTREGAQAATTEDGTGVSTDKENVDGEKGKGKKSAGKGKKGKQQKGADVVEGLVQTQWLALSALLAGEFKLTGAPAKVLERVVPSTGKGGVNKSSGKGAKAASKAAEGTASIKSFFKPAGK